MSRRLGPRAAEPSGEFISDREVARVLNIGMTRLFELQQRDPTFPAPIWFGPRCKRHVREELLQWALSRRGAARGA